MKLSDFLLLVMVMVALLSSTPAAFSGAPGKVGQPTLNQGMETVSAHPGTLARVFRADKAPVLGKTGSMPDTTPGPGPDDTDDSSGGSNDSGPDDSGPDSTGGTDF